MFRGQRVVDVGRTALVPKQRTHADDNLTGVFEYFQGYRK